MTRNRVALAVIGCLLSAAACSPESDIAVAFDAPQSSPVPEATSTPTPTPEPSPTPTPLPEAAPVAEGALLFETETGLARLGADGTQTTLVASASLDWVDIWPDGRVVGLKANTLSLWDDDADPATVRCRCVLAFPLQDQVVGVERSGTLVFFTGQLTPTAPAAGGGTDAVTADGALWWAGTSYDGAAVLVSGAPEGVVHVVSHSGEVREIATTAALVADVKPSLDPTGQVLAVAIDEESPECLGAHSVITVDLANGTATPLSSLWPPLIDGGGTASIVVSALAWAGQVLHIDAVVAQPLGQPPEADGEGAACDQWAPAVFGNVDGSWALVDGGPVAVVAALDPATKAYLVPNPELTTPSEATNPPGVSSQRGVLYWEQAGEATEVSTNTAVIAVAPSNVPTDLAPQTVLTPSASATRASLLLAAETDSPTNIAEAAGAGFGFSFDPDLLADPSADPVDFWEDQAACCDFSIGAIVAQLLQVAPIQVLDVDGTTVFEWREANPNGWRIGIDASGATRWIITGQP